MVWLAFCFNPEKETFLRAMGETVFCPKFLNLIFFECKNCEKKSKVQLNLFEQEKRSYTLPTIYFLG